MSKKFVIKYDKKSDNQSSVPKYDRYFTENLVGFRTKNSFYFKNIINFIANIVDQINIKLTREGIYLTSMDSTHIALVDCFIPKTFFSAYNFTFKKNRDNEDYNSPTIIGINVSVMQKILNYIKQDDELIIYQTDNVDLLNISIHNTKTDKFYSMKLMEIMSDELQIFELEDTSHIVLESKNFQKIISELSDIGENINIVLNDLDNTISFKCEGDMTKLNMIFSDDSDIVYENLKPLNAKFSLKNMEVFSKGSNLNKNMFMDIGENLPVKLGYNFMDDGYIHYYLAPKIDDYYDD